ncbi:DUF5995 family protein [Myxococcota bacterium]|nr:DUF5995 family protein [Myxococcota bacterium]
MTTPQAPHPVDAALLALLNQPLPADIPDAIARMRALEAIIGPEDGLYPFTLLYRLTTEAVGAKAAAHWEDPEALARLDVHFAELFFEAVRGWLGPAPEDAPRAWKVLFRMRHAAPGPSRLRRALAGMNAHINRDLGVALTRVWQELGRPADDDTPMHRDFLRVNAILAETEPQAKGSLFEGWLRDLDGALGEYDDLAALWAIARARDFAWQNGQAQWALRSVPPLRDALVHQTDLMTSALGGFILRAPGV